MSTLAIHGGSPVRTRPFGGWPVFGPEEEAALLAALRSGVWGSIDGTYVKQLEVEFAALQGARYGVSCVNGTMALSVALKALGIGPGDEVLVPPYTFIATASAALMIGAIPVFVDVELDTLLIDPALIDAAVSPRTKAIIPVHHAGSPADMDGVMAAAERHGLRVIEDAAQAHGAAWRGTPVGAIGDIGTFSFQSSKPINAGEGGMMTTNDAALDELLWSYRNVGRRRGGEWYEHVRLGWNLRMTEFQAAVLLEQMKRMPAQQAHRIEAAAYLSDRLGAIPGVVPLRVPDGVTAHSWYSYHWRWLGAAEGGLPKPAFADALRAEGVPVFGGYTPLNRNQAVRDEIARLGGTEPGPCPNAERAETDEILMFSMPILMGTHDDIDDVVEAVAKVAAVRP
ncbi:MAG TPA: DegT/DnrJ/EryC1/StrS family aminotransferase [Candidatus Limnocylindrales bacterium]|jgi:dTDP-4-amino-4,6-dideoxygalactose transaminase|nr:DegT/DnrJ/EryC1/StrS family aminotransferase [Candidatus Limnocylindrales bacterium]